MLSRAEARNNGSMPELPDLRILADAFTASLAGRALESATLVQPLVLRGTTAELREFEDLGCGRVEQRGKFLTLHFGDHRIVINAMLTGRLGLAEPGTKALSATALVLDFGPRAGSATGNRDRGVDTRRRLAARRRHTCGAALSRPEADGQGLLAAIRRRTSGRGLGDDGAGCR